MQIKKTLKQMNFYNLYNFLIHKVLKITTSLILYKKNSLYNYFIKNLHIGSYCYSYYGVKLFNVDFKDITFKYSCGGAYGMYLSNFLTKYNNNFKFIDIGSNIGIYSLIASENLKCKKIYAIEPVKSTFVKLKKNLKGKNSNAINCAISSINGYGYIAVHKFDSGSSKISKKNNKNKKYLIKRILIQNYKLFDKINSNNKLDFICKIDVEGNEKIVLNEIKKSSIYKNIKFFYIECDNDNKSINRLTNNLKNFHILNIEPIIVGLKKVRLVNIMFKRVNKY